LSRLKGFEKEARKAVQWLKDMQNRDGGWAAFKKNNVPIPFVDALVRPIKDSASLYDESCPDITGHVLEAFAAVGENLSNSESVRRGVHYLEGSRDSATGAWQGRWGINYFYGTGAAVVGLRRAGMSSEDPVLKRALDFLLSKQNGDGGFGESSRSYVDKSFAGRGISTPTQTAWVLLAMLETLDVKSSSIEKAVSFLLRSSAQGKWTDPSAVGTGHPGIVYMEYPSYPLAFPLMALGRYARKL
jgi:squalene-hopene/tetraprenyl-beta-curcumene cyclase